MKIKLEWSDYRLQWNPRDYDEIKLVVVPVTYVWNPDTALLNGVDGEVPGYPRVHLEDLTLQIVYTGEILKVTPNILLTPCLMDIKHFPVDEQTCHFEFGQWKYYDRMVQLRPGVDHAPKENHVDNVEWSIIGSRVTAVSKNFIGMDSKNDSFTSIIVTINIQRKPLYYVVNVIAPCIVVSVLSVISFCLPSSSSEKLDLSINLLLTMYVFNLLVIDILPATAVTVPYLTAYILFNMSVIGISLATTMVVLKIYKMPSQRKQMPPLVRKIFLGKLAKYLRVDVHASCERQEVATLNQVGVLRVDDKYWSSIPAQTVLSSQLVQHGRSNRRHSVPFPQFNVGRRKLRGTYKRRRLIDEVLNVETRVLPALDRMTELLQKLVKHFVPDRKYEKLDREWTAVAMVIDRLILLLFGVVYLVGASVMLPRIT
ncbi:neuronal acetylcholine receptor subunit alpha-2-like [Ptychodera flava]|uniref:neuronal acetylcholine receptor subunit alpha-2-like n=1 Tax=Ptychodera flava TaxID=63121 RepID=UPI00396A490D